MQCKICQLLTFYLVKSSPLDIQIFIQRRRFIYAITVRISYIHRLYTRPKDGYEIDVLSSPAYEKVMENNVKLDLSFNDLYISIEKTLKEPKSALFAKSYYGLPWHCQVKFD